MKPRFSVVDDDWQHLFWAFTCVSCNRTVDVRDLREVQGVSVCPDCIWEPEVVR